MCGIFCVYKKQGDLQAYRPRAIALSKQQRHRGPDWSGCVVAQDSILVHERLAIVGVGEYSGWLCAEITSSVHWLTRAKASG